MAAKKVRLLLRQRTRVAAFVDVDVVEECLDVAAIRNVALAFPLAEARTRLDAAELMVRKAAWKLDAGEPCGAEANMAKWLAADAAFQAADQA